MEDLFKKLQELTAVTGVSGREHEVVKVLKEQFSALADDVIVDSFGNIAALLDGGLPGPKVMVAVHSDEVGAVVTAVTPDGFLRIHTVGVVDCKIFPGIRLLVDNRVIGTVVCVPGHTSSMHGSEKNDDEGLLVDIGAKSAAQVAEWCIEPGLTVNYVSPLTKLTQENLVMGKAVDNRVGCLILLRLFEYLQGKKFPGTLCGVVTVQEEIGMRGARMITNRINPDFAIVIDTVPLDDTPLKSMPDVPLRLGEGPVLQRWIGKDDLFLGTVASESVSKLLCGASDELGLPLQYIAAYGKWVTDGATIHTTGSGVPTSFLSIPRRYGHTPNEIIDLFDVQSAIEIMKYVIEKISADYKPEFLLD